MTISNLCPYITLIVTVRAALSTNLRVGACLQDLQMCAQRRWACVTLSANLRQYASCCGESMSANMRQVLIPMEWRCPRSYGRGVCAPRRATSWLKAIERENPRVSIVPSFCPCFSIFLSVSQSARLFVFLSICLPFFPVCVKMTLNSVLPLCQCIGVLNYVFIVLLISFFFQIVVFLSIYLSVSLSCNLSVCFSVSLGLSVSVFLTLNLSLSLSFSLSLSLSIYLSIYLSI